jgi:nitrite reductase/ring-hydroxylating ferredoxin subunit
MPEWVSVPKAAGLLEGTMMALSIHGKHLIVYKTSAGYFAGARRCTHQAADLMRGYFDGNVIECPVHQGRFDVRNGAALSAPASTPLQTYPVKVVDGEVFVEI